MKKTLLLVLSLIAVGCDQQRRVNEKVSDWQSEDYPKDLASLNPTPEELSHFKIVKSTDGHTLAVMFNVWHFSNEFHVLGNRWQTTNQCMFDIAWGIREMRGLNKPIGIADDGTNTFH